MAAFETTTRSVPFGAISTYRALQAISAPFAAIAAWNDARMTRAALSRLSDRELDDIGLCRAEIGMIGRR